MNAKILGQRRVTLAMIAVALLTLVLAMAARPAFAFAEDGASSASESASASAAASSASAEAAESGESTQPPSSAATFSMTGNDFIWFGRSLELGKYEIANDLIAAGQTVNLSDITALGDFRLAAQDVTLKDSIAFENITAAGETVRIKDSTANAIMAAGRTVAFSGSCNALTAFAEKVYIDGEVEGDVIVGASFVEVGANARIKGTLYVSAPQEPTVQQGAEVGDVKFTKTESSSSSASSAVPDIGNALAGFGSMLYIMFIVIGILSTLLIAVLAEWLFKHHTAAAADMIRSRTGATIGTGIVGAIVAPIVIIILFILGVTAPVAIALIFALLAMSTVACGFMGASLFKLVFKRLGRFKCALAGGAIVGVATAIPFLGALVGVVAFMYITGYVLQSIYLGTRKQTPNAPTAPMDNPPSAAPVAPVAPAASVAPVAPAASVAPAAPVASVAPTAPIAPSSDPTLNDPTPSDPTPDAPVE